VALISKEGLPLCDCCGAPLADLIGLARSTGAKRCPPPPPSPFASPSVKCRVRGGGLHRWVCVCSRPLGPRSYWRHVSARALSVHALLEACVCSRPLGPRNTVSIFPRPDPPPIGQCRDEIHFYNAPHPLPSSCTHTLQAKNGRLSVSSGATHGMEQRGEAQQCEGRA